MKLVKENINLLRSKSNKEMLDAVKPYENMIVQVITGNVANPAVYQILTNESEDFVKIENDAISLLARSVFDPTDTRYINTKSIGRKYLQTTIEKEINKLTRVVDKLNNKIELLKKYESQNS